MKTSLSAFVAVALIAAPAAFAAEATPADRTPPAKAPSAMTPTEIKAFNEGLPQTHPYYIKCRKTLEIGSLVRKLRVCHTNAEWRRITDKGNQDARDSMETLARGWSNSQEPSGTTMREIRPQ